MGGDWVLSPLLKFCEMKKRRKINVHIFYPLNSVLLNVILTFSVSSHWGLSSRSAG